MTINVDELVSALEERFRGLAKQYELEPRKHGIGARIYSWMEDAARQWWDNTDDSVH